MNKYKLLYVLFFLFFPGLSMAQQDGLKKKVLVTLQDGEELMYGENCVYLSNSGINSYFITTLDDKYYIYDNGRREGPFDELTEEMGRVCEGKSSGNASGRAECYGAEGIQDVDHYVKHFDQGDDYAVEVNGKTSMRFRSMVQFVLCPDLATWYALVLDKDSKCFLISSAGHKVEIPGMPGQMSVSPDCATAVVIATGTFNLLDPAMAEKVTKDPAAYLDDMNKAFIYTINGKMAGPLDAGKLNSTVWYCTTSGSKWFYFIDNDLFMNGQFLRHFEEYCNPNELFIDRTGQKFAQFNYEMLKFSDGSQFQYPMNLSVAGSGGKYTFSWTSLENKKELVHYSKDF